MRKAGGVTAIIAGIFGVVAAVATLTIGGIGTALETEESGTVVMLGWGGVGFSFLTIVLGAITMGARGRTPGVLLIVCAGAGAILGGTFVAVFMALAGIGGILGSIPGKRTEETRGESTSPNPATGEAGENQGDGGGQADERKGRGGKQVDWRRATKESPAMPQVTTIHSEGHLGTDVRINDVTKGPRQGQRVATARLACDIPVHGTGRGSETSQPLWIRIVAFNEHAEVLARLRKGDAVAFGGTLRWNIHQPPGGGAVKSTWECIASRVEAVRRTHAVQDAETHAVVDPADAEPAMPELKLPPLPPTWDSKKETAREYLERMDAYYRERQEAEAREDAARNADGTR